MYKDIIQGKKAVLFDLDGTIVDSVYLWKKAFLKVLEEIGAGFVEYDKTPDSIGVQNKWEYILGIESEYITTELTPKQLTDKTYEAFLEIWSSATPEIRNGFWPFVYELKEEKKLKLALTTNNPKNVTDKMLERLGIFSTFDLIITLDDVKHPKPNPEIYKKAAKLLNISPKEALVFEDSVAGTMAAVAAKMDVIAVHDGSIPKAYYPKETALYTSDFEGFVGNLDTTLIEDIKNSAAEIAKDKEQNPTEIA
jgi:beta-phosphoglucomutase